MRRSVDDTHPEPDMEAFPGAAQSRPALAMRPFVAPSDPDLRAPARVTECTPHQAGASWGREPGGWLRAGPRLKASEAVPGRVKCA